MTQGGSFQPDAFAGPGFVLEPEQILLPEGPARDRAIVVEAGRIADLGPAAAVAGRRPDLPRIALPNRLVMPGLIDIHHHLTQSFGKALAFGEPSEIFRRIWVPLESSLDDEIVHASAKLAALEALRGGFTTVVDAGTRAAGDVGAIARATEAAGLRCVLGFICNDLGGGKAGDPDAILAAADAHLARFPSGGLVHPSLAVSIPEVASDRMLAAVAARCREAGAIFQTHANEHLVAVERSLVARGERPIEHLASVGALGPATLLAHATLVTPSELARIADSGAAVAYNPVATVWKGNAAAPALDMIARGIPVGLGTDGTRSDGFRLLDAAETVQRLAFGLATGDSSCGGGWTWLEAGTSGGARAAGLGGVTGTIAPGLAADLLVVDLAVPEMRPSWDLPWELIRLGNRDQIEAVLVAGRLRLWRGWPVDWDARRLMAQVAARAEAAVAAAPIQRVHPVSTRHRVGRAGPRRP
ncbi:amidohydrolase family protein [Methylobacterium sp. DB0501]|nr:amidohydrolase family protein [Methylobacterium sp. DB0501]